MDLLKVTFTILLLLFPLGQIARFKFQNGAATILNDIFVGVVVVIWLMVARLKKQSLKTSLTKPILAFAIIGFLSLIINMRFLDISQFFISSLYGVRWLFYAMLFFVVSGFDLKFKKRIVIIMIFVGTVVVLGGYMQYFLYPSLRNLYYLGWDEHLYRMFSSFLDPNFAASIISLFLILVLSILLSRHSGLTRVSKRLEILDAPFGLTRMTQGIFLVLVSIFAFIALLLTYSRSGYLMFFVSAVSLLLMFGKKKYVVILVLIFVIGIILLPKNLGGEGVKLLRTESLISRSQYLNNAIIIFRDHPVLGVGFNSYRYAQYRYGFIDDISLKTSHAGSGTDNSFLFVLATTGIVGFTFYLYMWFKILKSCHHTKKEGLQKTISCVVIASTVGLFVNAFFINSLFYPSIMLWMWVLVGLLENKN